MKWFGAVFASLMCMAQLSFAAPQVPTVESTDADLAKVKTLRTRVLKPQAAADSFARFKKNQQVTTMAQWLVGVGYKAGSTAKDFFSLEETYRQPDGTAVKFSMVVQNYSKPNARDLGALGVVTLSSGEEVQRYVFSLEAPGGDFASAVEHQVDAQLVVGPSHSFWSCFWNRIKKKCAGQCFNALTSCLTSAGGSWVTYLTCLAADCGGCAFKAFTCCGCNCGWWCGWAAGCCHR